MYLSDEQKMNIIKFCKKDMEKNYTGFSKDRWNEFEKIGILSCCLKNKNESYHLNYKQIAELLIILGEYYGDIGMVFTLNNHLWACRSVIEKFGTKSLKEKYLYRLNSGEYIGGFAITEPNAGSDAFAIKTACKKIGQFYLLNGRKRFVSNAPIADVVIVIAKEEGILGIRSINAFVVDINQDGVCVEEIKKAGLHSCPFGDIVLKDCLIDESNLLGKWGNGTFIINYALEMERCFEFACYIGCLKKMLKIGIDLEKKSKLCQEEQFLLAELATVTKLSETYLYSLADMKDKKKKIYTEASIFKLFISEVYLRYSKKVLDMCYKYCDNRAIKIEEEYMGAVASTIYSGTSSIQKKIIFDSLLRGYGNGA